MIKGKIKIREQKTMQKDEKDLKPFFVILIVTFICDAFFFRFYILRLIIYFSSIFLYFLLENLQKIK